MSTETSQDLLRRLGPVFARLGIWHAPFAAAEQRLRHASLQKITASDEGYICLSVYKPGDDRSSVILSIRKAEAGVVLSFTKPKPQLQPNSFIQMARKHLLGRKIEFVYASLDPVCFFIELAPKKDDEDSPNLIILDLDQKPARVIIARFHNDVPQRYASTVSDFHGQPGFFESYCEWSLEGTKTKKRATFTKPLVTYGWYHSVKQQPGTIAPFASPLPRRLPIAPQTVEENSEESPAHSFGFAEKKAFEQKEMNLAKAMSLLPVHVRKSVKNRLQFLERRLLRQRADLPADTELIRLTKRAEGLRAHLYLWPEGSLTWYVPPDLVENSGLPTFFQLSSGQKPGDLLDELFREIDKLKRRRQELLSRLESSKKAIDDFHEQVIRAGESIEAEIAALAPLGQFTIKDLGIYFSRIQPVAAVRLCDQLATTWNMPGAGQTHSKKHRSEKDEKLPYRVFQASTGEFIHVARSASDGDLMIKLMPSHHMWLHVLTGEGSHVWLEKPKKEEPSPHAIREAAILAIHNSRLSRGRQGEVRVATRADIEKKKDLPPGKVLVRRCKTILVKYESADLESILKHNQGAAGGRS